MNASASLDWELVRELKEIMADGFITLVDSYERDTAKRLAEMSHAVELGDRNLVRQLAHSLKGSSSNLGAIEVTAHCVDLERSAAAAAEEELASLLGRLEASHDQALAALRSCVDS
ncbi:Hpt domain-containing protein [Alcanivorax sp. 1008]|uniref:Hpt domain-containing protein n=1 Tax=Alcanivorax sp. 1008 TaxID=2816853 RepID=UPI001DBBF5FF|nr:Hpt domain-containing protein [Alcanivorax sp. 1008]MCC1495672.1 Hpt domain-containing protein [Alcanivorax sp. 1008]